MAQKKGTKPKRALAEVPVPRASGLTGLKHQEQISGSAMDPLRAQQLAAELEVEMMADMYNRMTNACHRKCVPPHYKEAELSKGESVCLDRCVSKYLDIHERMGKKLTELSMQDEELMKRMQQGAGPA
ncbi:mitochondrial import inner membrane translocase subunit Tim10 [Anolis carolinensis]|uniref:mitochondrial import inner membrane translocase subunit Tim10 n=1 Tax=Anolis carolinensis TaxID=28377 RepID=UPI0004628237|nr:PREDICTED: mitochondrial import inner membrane translocase subunit Tim10 [Anolis carolinensis]|eukprot:XP_003215014.2 PREDICTED: mitochondrial import inner membrane translocase subunit Tim10 [Anolis carolinensis]